jgi:hypothetical protein
VAQGCALDPLVVCVLVHLGAGGLYHFLASSSIFVKVRAYGHLHMFILPNGILFIYINLVRRSLYVHIQKLNLNQIMTIFQVCCCLAIGLFFFSNVWTK